MITDLKFVLIGCAVVCFILTAPAFAYVSSSVDVYLGKLIAGVEVAIVSGIAIYWSRTKKKAMGKLGIGENAKKEVGSGNIASGEAMASKGKKDKTHSLDNRSVKSTLVNKKSTGTTNGDCIPDDLNCKMINSTMKRLYLTLGIILIGFIVFGIAFATTLPGVIDRIYHPGKYGLYIQLCWLLMLCLITSYKVCHYFSKDRNANISFFIFIIALIPRLYIVSLNVYSQTSDFVSYLNFGINMYNGNTSEVSRIISTYGLPNFGGLAVYNALIAELFSPTLQGYQIASCIMSSIITVLVYKLISPYNSKIAIIASILYAFYPSSIVQVACNTNYHAETMFDLIAAYIVQRVYVVHNEKKRARWFWYIALCSLIGVLIAIADMMHQSSIVFLVAILFWMIVEDMTRYNSFKERMQALLCHVGTTLLSFLIFTSIILNMLIGYGIVANVDKPNLLGKFAVGLSQNSRGKYSREIYKEIGSLPEEGRTEASLNIIKREIGSDIVEVLKLFVQKNSYTWFSNDSGLGFWTYESRYRKLIQDKETRDITIDEQSFIDFIEQTRNPLINLDTQYVFFLYVFALAGVIVSILKKGKQYLFARLAIWMMLGWMGVYLLIEVQSRYRYCIMPWVCVMAAIGITWVGHIFKKISDTLKRTRLFI